MISLKEYRLSEVDNLKVHGRTTGDLSPLTLFWTASGIELNIKASELWVEMEADYLAHEPWISIIINGVNVSRQMVTRGKKWVCLFRGMNSDTVKKIRILKENQALNEDPLSCLVVHGVKCDGEFLPVKDRPYKIEFIGDSITSGEGVLGTKDEDDWIMMWFSAVYNYTYMVAEELNADYRVLSQSGWGVYTSYDNNPYKSLPDYYEKVCGTLGGEMNKRLGAQENNDFSLWQPDIIVVNLGTNDEGAFNNPEWKDEQTGKIYKQRKNADGSYNVEDLKKFEEAVKKFLYKLRSYNPDAHIIWAYGMLGDTMLPAINRGIENYQLQSNDNKVSVILLPNTREETVGARYHPGIQSHKEAAKVVVDYIKNLVPGTK
ncbi:MAG: SGNH/GDSL hydrolase family protein [Clostridiales bacterium]|nr:SGNH/GDSL hydrolase family protein [Clostridiales bacterium]